jgi:hypothetical protein
LLIVKKPNSDGSNSPLNKRKINETSLVENMIPFSQIVNDIKHKRGLSKIEDDNYVDIHGKYILYLLNL